MFANCLQMFYLKQNRAEKTFYNRTEKDTFYNRTKKTVSAIATCGVYNFHYNKMGNRSSLFHACRTNFTVVLSLFFFFVLFCSGKLLFIRFFLLCFSVRKKILGLSIYYYLRFNFFILTFL